jgi:hypothetical protein
MFIITGLQARSKFMKTIKVFAAVFAIVLIGLSANAAIPQTINYQGLLTDSGGNPLSDSTYSVTFTIYDMASGGTNLWTETQNVSTMDGLFTVNLGAVNAISEGIFSDSSRFLGVKVNPNVEFAPRTKLVSSPFSLRVATVDGAMGGTITSKVTIGSSNINTGTDAFAAGFNNRARGAYSVVSGGGGLNLVDSNSALGISSTVSGGQRNSANDDNATVGGGILNRASGFASTVSGGQQNVASGSRSSIPGGINNIASGSNSVAAGSGAEAIHVGSFVWSDGTGPGGHFTSTNDRQFLINASGGVGIGTNSPNKQLSVAGSMEIGTGAGDYQHLRVGGGNSSGFLYGSYPFYGDGIHIGYNYYADASNHHVINSGGAMSRLSLGYGEIGMYVSDLAYPYLPNRLGIYINGFGDVGIGTAPSYKLDVSGSAHASSFPTSSDNRLKKNVKPLSGVLEKLNKIRGVSFDWNEKYENMGRATGHREIGVIAQEVENVFPELVTKWGQEDFRAVDYSRMTAVLIEAVKEQQRQIEELKGRIVKLEKKRALANLLENSDF